MWTIPDTGAGAVHRLQRQVLPVQAEEWPRSHGPRGDQAHALQPREALRQAAAVGIRERQCRYG